MTIFIIKIVRREKTQQFCNIEIKQFLITRNITTRLMNSIARACVVILLCTSMTSAKKCFVV